MAGRYFIEDVGAMRPVASLVAAWSEAKLSLDFGGRSVASRQAQAQTDSAQMPMPADIAFLNVFDNAVVIGKDTGKDRHVRSSRGERCGAAQGQRRRRGRGRGGRGHRRAAADS